MSLPGSADIVDKSVRFSGVRKVIAGRMQHSLQSTAQLSYHASADITAISALLQGWKAAGKVHGLQDCLILALCQSLKLHPLLNGTAEEAGYTLAGSIDLSVALSTRNGLVTPVLRGIDNLGVEDIAIQRRELTARALAGTLKVSEMTGGSFTLSNLGLTVVEHFTPILNAPQIAILGVGRMRTVPDFAADGSIAARKLLPLSLTADHRVVDGEPAGRFLTELVGLLENDDWAARG